MLGRKGKSTEYLRNLREAIKNGTLTKEQKDFLDDCTKNNQPTVEMLEHFVNMQTVATKYKTTEPLLLRRRVTDLGFCRELQIGDVYPFQGITSTFATEEAFNTSKVIKLFGKAVIEIRVSVGTHCIPIGMNGVADNSEDEIALPHGTRAGVLEFQITGDTPHMIVEVIPEPVETL